MADLDGRRVAQRRRRAAVSEGGAAVSACGGVRRGARDDGAIIGRLSLARDTHPASAHVADLGLMVAQDARRQGVGRALLEAAVEWARGSRRAEARAARLPVERAGDPAVRAVRVRARGVIGRGTTAGRGKIVDAILMAHLHQLDERVELRRRSAEARKPKRQPARDPAARRELFKPGSKTLLIRLPHLFRRQLDRPLMAVLRTSSIGPSSSSRSRRETWTR